MAQKGDQGQARASGIRLAAARGSTPPPPRPCGQSTGWGLGEQDRASEWAPMVPRTLACVCVCGGGGRGKHGGQGSAFCQERGDREQVLGEGTQIPPPRQLDRGGEGTIRRLGEAADTLLLHLATEGPALAWVVVGCGQWHWVPGPGDTRRR